MNKDAVSTLSDAELLDELSDQIEYQKDDAFEYAAFSRGDGGMKRGAIIYDLYQEAVRRGLREPLPPLPEETAEFDDLCREMARQGYEWNGGMFRKWGEPDSRKARPQLAAMSFETAIAAAKGETP